MSFYFSSLQHTLIIMLNGDTTLAYDEPHVTSMVCMGTILGPGLEALQRCKFECLFISVHYNTH
jgi:hypothetical protein